MTFRWLFEWQIAAAILAPLALIIFYRLFRRRHSPELYSWLRRIFILIFLALIIFRPASPGDLAHRGATNLDVFFVVDITNSMIAEDWNGQNPRLDGVKQDMEAIMAELVGARFSVITFGLITSVETPLTTDTTAIQSIIDTIMSEITEHTFGTNIDAPLDTLLDTFRLHAQTYETREAILYFFSDGEQTIPVDIRSFALLSPFVAGGAILGYGTEEGGYMRTVTATGVATAGQEWILHCPDRPSWESCTPDERAVSRIDHAALRRIATEVGVPYHHRTAPSSAEAFANPADLSTVEFTDDEIETFADHYWIPAIALAALATWELLSWIGIIFTTNRAKEQS